MASPYATLTGTWNKPALKLFFNPHQPHATVPAKTLTTWVEEYLIIGQQGRAYWNSRERCWVVTATGPDASRKFQLAGFLIDHTETSGTTLEAVLNLDELVAPITRLTDMGNAALVLPRLLGFDRTKEALGSGARWDREFKRFSIPVSDAMHKGAPRPLINWEPNILEAARTSLGRVNTPAEIAAATAAAGASKDPLEMDADDLAKLIEVVGDIPEWFGLDLFPFQRIGSIAVAAGHFGLFDEPGLGKANSMSEPILTPSGWTTMGQIAVGDEVVGSNGHPTEVLRVFPQGEIEIAKVSFTDGTFSLCSWDHLWSATTPNDRSRGHEARVHTTRELLDQGLMSAGKRKWQIPMVEPVQFVKQPAPEFDAYALGVLLGDGHIDHSMGVTTDHEIVANLILPSGAATKLQQNRGDYTGQYSVTGIAQHMRRLSLYGTRSETKFIPKDYLFGSVSDRIALLQGLLDSDGGNALSRGKPTATSVEYGTVSEQLCDDVTHMVQSLGGTATTKTKWPTYTYNGEKRTGQLFYRMVISLPSGITPFRLGRKLARWAPRTKYQPSRRIVSIESSHTEEAQCIKVAAADELYVTRSFIVTHNTRQTIAAAAILKSERTLITCLPVGLTGWAREIEESLLHTLGGKYPDGEIVIIRSGKKEPETLPERGVIITSDSLITARPALLQRLIEWQPDVFGYDEAHRGKTYDSARSQAMLQLSSATVKAPIPITGTPIFANPSELAPLLEFSGHLAPVFNGLDAYLARYCKQDHFGNWKVRKEHLPELRELLSRNVWVRRRKRDVLPDLPQTLKVPKWVDVPLTEYRKAHKDAIFKLTLWVKQYRLDNDGVDPDEDIIREFAATQVGLVSVLRRAAGLAKIPALVADIQTHVTDTATTKDGKPFFPRPLIVWTHHKDVSAAMSEAIPTAVAQSGVIRGGVGHAERDRLVSEFQAGRIGVLVCSIAAAGVAITLTAASDMFFAESDWTPAAIRQAMDRAERIGQTADKIIATTYLAPGTLDMRIQKVLKEKSKILDVIYGDGNDVSVLDESAAIADDVASSTDIIFGLVTDILQGQVEKP